MRATPSHFATSSTFGRRLAPWLFFKKNLPFGAIPPKLRSLNAANMHFFYTKMNFFLKKFAYLHFL